MNQRQENVEKTAWIVAIGDELISGQRLDTNSQWISQRLEPLGVEVVRHCCVGDKLEAGVTVLEDAIRAADFVICTGGIGPTKDDLTRQVVAEVAGVELSFDPETEHHIKRIFASYGREMPENNLIQAYFPEGSIVIQNPEGTAPGIDIVIGRCRLFALPGVPYEMKQMWEDHVESAIVAQHGGQQVIRHHAVHCFGAGESQIELMLAGMTDRDHVPRVGITASQATISLRITAAGETDANCQQIIDETVKRIQTKLGNLVFGHNGIELQDVIVAALRQRQQTLAIVDYAFGGVTARLLHDADVNHEVLLGANVTRHRHKVSKQDMPGAGELIRANLGADFAIIISSLYEFEKQLQFDVAIVGDEPTYVTSLKYAGHSGLRQARTAKQILNEFRLFLDR